jgi:hypothetical protein
MEEHIERCKKLALVVDNLSQTELEEMFKMIHKNNCEYTKNNNGIFVNLTWIPKELLEQLEKYVLFCSCSGNELKKYESLCDVLDAKLRQSNTSSHNEKQINNIVLLDKTDKKIAEENEEEQFEKGISKISPTLRFSLLKKKLSKTNVIQNIYENDLKQEEFILV